MNHMKKVSVLIEPELWRRARQAALDREIPLTELIRIALQAELDRPRKTASAK